MQFNKSYSFIREIAMRWIWAGLLAIIFPAFAHAGERMVAAFTNTDDILNITVSGNAVLCGTWEGGLARYDRKTGIWKAYTSLDGLANNTVTSVTVDSKNGLWVAHSNWGLSYFDGAGWNTYSALDGFLGGASVGKICEDSDGRIWCSTSEGVYYLDGTNWVQSLGGGAASFIAAGKDGMVWCCQNHSLVRYDGSEWRVFTDKDTGIPLSHVSNLLFDKNNVLWFALWGGDMAGFDGKTWIRPALPEGTGPVYSFPAIGADGNLWITWGGNICRFGDAKKWEIVVPWNTLREAFTTVGLTMPGRIVFQVDDEGVFWLADESIQDNNHIHGLFRFDGKKIEVIRRSSMAFLRPAAIAEDHSGSIWAAGLYGDGISRFDGSEWTSFFNIPGVPYYEFTGIAVDGNNNIWCAAPFGVLRYDGTTWHLFNRSNSGLPNDDITSLYLDSRGVLWFDTQSGLTSYDGSVWKTYDKYTTGLDLSKAACICEDGTGAIIAGGDSLFACFDGTVWKNEIPAPNGWKLNISHVAKAPDGNLWCVGFLYKLDKPYEGNSLLYRYDGTSWVSFPVQSVSALAVDTRNIVWIGSNDKKGVSSFDGTTWTKYGYETGLATHVVHTIFVDKNNTKWIGTEDGMFCIGGAPPSGIFIKTGQQNDVINLSGHPNPFNTAVAIDFTLSSDERTELAVFSVNGQKVKVLKDTVLPAGAHSVVWDGRDDSGRPVSSGTYMVRLMSGRSSSTRKLLLMK